jgi:hypothetical protein
MWKMAMKDAKYAQKYFNKKHEKKHEKRSIRLWWCHMIL